MDQLLMGCLNPHEMAIVKAAFVRNKLHVVKPFSHIDYRDHSQKSRNQASTNYIWQILCYDYVDCWPYWQIPSTADIDLRNSFQARFNPGNTADGFTVAHHAADPHIEGLNDLIRRVESNLWRNEPRKVRSWLGPVGLD